MLLELPADVYNSGDVPEKIASKKLFEETGYKTRELISLGSIFECPTKDSHHIDLFLAKDVKYHGANSPEKTEDIEVVLIPLKSLIQKNNPIIDVISRSEVVLSDSGFKIAHRDLNWSNMGIVNDDELHRKILQMEIIFLFLSGAQLPYEVIGKFI